MIFKFSSLMPIFHLHFLPKKLPWQKNSGILILMIQIKKSLIAILLFLAMAIPVHGGQSLTIVRGQDFPPYHFMDKNGKENGFIIEIISQVAASMEIKVNFDQYPWSRCIHMVKTGQADAMMNLFKTEKRIEFLYFSDNVLTHEVNLFFALKDSPISYSGDLSSLADLKIAAIRNYSYGTTFDHQTFPLIVRLETEKDLINSLINKRCDLIAGNNMVIQTLLKQMGLGNRVKALSPRISNDPLYLGFSKARGHKILAKKFSDQLGQFKETPVFRALIQKYGL